MEPKRLTFVMEQTLGHIPFAQNLQKTFDTDQSVDISWLKVDYTYQKWFEKLPVIRTNWSLRGSLKARLSVRGQNRHKGKSDLYLFHTQVISLLSVGWWLGKVPTIISLDATPLNYDRVGLAYGHRTDNLLIEKFKFWLNKRAFHKATYLITWSEWARQSLIRDYRVSPDKIEVIPPGTNLDFWQGSSNKLENIQGRKLKILFVGGDFERKGGKLLYEVFKKSLFEKYELHLVTKDQVEAGDGIFIYRNIQPNSPEIQKLFTQADVFVLPTEGDCLPMAIIEAMAAGLPVVSTRLGAIEEAIVDSENGFLINPGDNEALVEVLLRFVEQPTLVPTIASNNRKRAEKSFDVNKNGRHFIEICNKVSGI